MPTMIAIGSNKTSKRYQPKRPHTPKKRISFACGWLTSRQRKKINLKKSRSCKRTLPLMKKLTARLKPRSNDFVRKKSAAGMSLLLYAGRKLSATDGSRKCKRNSEPGRVSTTKQASNLISPPREQRSCGRKLKACRNN